ncbi:MAG: 30S ribosomal protein S6 [Planctomycetes bacterium]|nr:30S ribosomal protein S6 [Planctomycetota bacterium]
METVAKNKLYEGMFLIDSSQAAADWDGTIATIRTILEKVEAEIDSIRKWDERRLAYDIKGKSRGTYILSYFRVDGERIQDIERSVQLSEKIMRVLILSAERQRPEDIEKDTPATKVEKEKEKRKAAKEAAQEAKVKQVSAPEEAGEAEKAEGVEQMEETKQSPEKAGEAEKTEGVEQREETKQSPEKAGEAEKTEGAEQREETKQSPEEKTEKTPESEVSTAADDLIEKQPEQEQVEGSEQS